MPTIPELLKLSARSAPNATSSPPALQVICAFPVSGQYGAGSRILYYVLVITCIFARKADWLRNACLAAALVVPAVAAIHGIVLASVHSNGAVDLDIYGAFQVCSIAILAAPLTVRLSRTYFYDPGRNIIFVWTTLILAGLISLCVEFYRATPTPCTHDNNNNPLRLTVKDFPYGSANCGLTCSQQAGPFSPLRNGQNNEIYVIPAPTRLTINAGMLLAAGFCIPAILSLIFTWDKILEINWKRRREHDEPDDAPVEGANVTVGEMKGINKMVRMFLNVVEVPVFGGAVLAILGIGEANFFSEQLNYQTESMASVGQWGPIAGTAIAAIGSLYLLWFKDEEQPGKEKEKPNIPYAPSESSHRGRPCDRILASELTQSPNQSPSGLGIYSSPSMDIRRSTTMHRIPTIVTEPEIAHFEHRPSTSSRSPNAQPQNEPKNLPTAGRRQVRGWFTQAANYLGNAAHQKLDTSDYRDEKAHRFPEIPGETLRNPGLERISRQYSELREQRAASQYSPSIGGDIGGEGSRRSGDIEPFPSMAPDEIHATGASERLEVSPSRLPKRRDTLEVPSAAHGHRRSESH